MQDAAEGRGGGGIIVHSNVAILEAARFSMHLLQHSTSLW